METLFTARLLERYQQTTPTITPRVSSLFEPDAVQGSVGAAFSPATDVSETDVSNEYSAATRQMTSSPQGLPRSAPTITPGHEVLPDEMQTAHRHSEYQYGISPGISSGSKATSQAPSFLVQPSINVVPRHFANPIPSDSHRENADARQQAVIKPLPVVPLSPSAATAVVMPVSVNAATVTVPPSAVSETELPPRRQATPIRPAAAMDVPSLFDNPRNNAKSAGVLSVPESLPLGFPKQETPQPSPPTINVTIGRLEVRANTAAPAKPRSQAVPRQPVMGLDEYLKNRGGRWS